MLIMLLLEKIASSITFALLHTKIKTLLKKPQQKFYTLTHWRN